MSIIEDKNITPLMRQYFAIREAYPDCILLFQVGDFYELFFDDARNAASILGITLTQRGTHNGLPIPLCGVPIHVIENYTARLIKAGFNVAFCDQLPAQVGAKIIDRKVTKVLTPGTLTDAALLTAKASSYVAVIVLIDTHYAFLSAEILTGNFFITHTSYDEQKLETELARFEPDEILIPETQKGKELCLRLTSRGYRAFLIKSTEQAAEIENLFFSWLKDKTKPQLYEFLKNSKECSLALRALYDYLSRNHSAALTFCKEIYSYASEDYLGIDASTQRNLELIKNNHDGSTRSTLFELLDCAATAMGSRMLKRLIVRPLLKQELIEKRLDALTFFINHVYIRESVHELLKKIGDLERVIGRVALERAPIHDYIQIKNGLEKIPQIQRHLEPAHSVALLNALSQKCLPLDTLYSLLDRALNADSSKNWIIQAGFNKELDQLRSMADNGIQEILKLEAQEQKRTGINSLKIRYNQQSGYAIEITKTHTALVPHDYIRLQILVGKDRFTLPALKELEYRLQKAEADAHVLQAQLFAEIKEQVKEALPELHKRAQALAHIDTLNALATISHAYNYVRPTFNDQQNIDIRAGKHPVLAAYLQTKFIPNNTSLSKNESLWIITGPNMGGKSTYLRQVALICLLAQLGCYVPAQAANLPLLDRIFTRIGAGDNLAQGKSTFFIEMEETAFICNQATHKSLVILDEVGRGTSTSDGLALAQAIAEYIHTKIKARCLFATHYHELTILAELLPGIKNYHAATQKAAGTFLLLHTIIPGISSGSFGLEVAKSANIPEEILLRAQEIQKK